MCVTCTAMKRNIKQKQKQKLKSMWSVLMCVKYYTNVYACVVCVCLFICLFIFVCMSVWWFFILQNLFFLLTSRSMCLCNYLPFFFSLHAPMMIIIIITHLYTVPRAFWIKFVQQWSKHWNIEAMTKIKTYTHTHTRIENPASNYSGESFKWKNIWKKNNYEYVFEHFFPLHSYITCDIEPHFFCDCNFSWSFFFLGHCLCLCPCLPPQKE